MTSKSKEKMAAAFRKLFRSSEKVSEEDGGSGGDKHNGSPARRLLPRHRDTVSPAEPSPPQVHSSSFFKKKPNPAASQPTESFTQKTVRTRRLMKELKDIQKNERKDDPVFTVSVTHDEVIDFCYILIDFQTLNYKNGNKIKSNNSEFRIKVKK